MRRRGDTPTAAGSVELPRHLRRTLGLLAPGSVALDARVRVRPWASAWLLTDPADAQHVLVTGARRYRKTPFLTSAEGRRRAGRGLLTSEGEEHMRQRRLLQPLFHRRAVERFASVVDERAERWIRSAAPGRALDLAAEMADLTRGVILAVLFGADLDAGAEARLADAIAARRRYTEYVYHGRLPWRSRLPTRILRANRDALAAIDAVLLPVLARRRARRAAGEASPEETDLIDELLAAERADGTWLTDAQVRDEVLTFTSTGYETLGEALTWAWYRLDRHPGVEADLVEAIRAGDGDGRAELVLAETMRLHPPTWIFSRVPVEPDVLPRGGPVEPGDTLFLCQYVLHRHPGFFPDPERFDPDRFADGRPARQAYLPFGDGAHKCIGEHLARLEGVRILARVTPRLRFRLLAPDRVEPRGGITLTPRGGLPARVEARDGH